MSVQHLLSSNPLSPESWTNLKINSLDIAGQTYTGSLTFSGPYTTPQVFTYTAVKMTDFVLLEIECDAGADAASNNTIITSTALPEELRAGSNITGWHSIPVVNNSNQVFGSTWMDITGRIYIAAGAATSSAFTASGQCGPVSNITFVYNTR